MRFFSLFFECKVTVVLLNLTFLVSCLAWTVCSHQAQVGYEQLPMKDQLCHGLSHPWGKMVSRALRDEWLLDVAILSVQWHFFPELVSLTSFSSASPGIPSIVSFMRKCGRMVVSYVVLKAVYGIFLQFLTSLNAFSAFTMPWRPRLFVIEAPEPPGG